MNICFAVTRHEQEKKLKHVNLHKHSAQTKAGKSKYEEKERNETPTGGIIFNLALLRAKCARRLCFSEKIHKSVFACVLCRHAIVGKCTKDEDGAMCTYAILFGFGAM